MYAVKLPSFEGPLDVLLNLIEERELDITKIALAQVTDQYISYIESHDLHASQLVEFLVIASQLLVMKAKALLPYLVESTPEEEEDAHELEARLRQLRLFRDLGDGIGALWTGGHQTYAREFGLGLEAQFLPGNELQSSVLAQAFREFTMQFPSDLFLEERSVAPIINIEEKFELIHRNLSRASAFSFSSLVKEEDVTHRIVTFLAMLEMIKQHLLTAEQGDLFSEINLKPTHHEAIV